MSEIGVWLQGRRPRDRVVIHVIDRFLSNDHAFPWATFPEHFLVPEFGNPAERVLLGRPVGVPVSDQLHSQVATG